jgi:hypothetical protein
VPVFAVDVQHIGAADRLFNPAEPRFMFLRDAIFRLLPDGENVPSNPGRRTDATARRQFVLKANKDVLGRVCKRTHS